MDKKEPVISNEKKINVDLSEEYFGESNKPKKAAATFVFVLVATIAFGALGWYVYKINNTIKSVDELDVIHASNQPVKVMPDDPGGMAVPDMDKSIYDNLSTSDHGKTDKVEKPIPAPEEPKIPTVSENAKPEINNNAKQTAIEKVEQEEIVRKNDSVSTFGDKVKIVQKETKQEDLRIKEKEIKQKMTSKKKGFYLQLAAFKTESDALKTWNKLQSKHADVIGKNFYIERKDLGPKGIFYRLQTGPYPSENEARHICQKLQTCGQNCFLVK